ncbi:TIGR04283 family arsenosugar biosynthesis glycosyltransferase [Blastopirellula sp. J2-11]|uniref:TIGR04283 family arsenosugar biosynthesis glycosyltransferase n=1 Tax=Blastopirellula sp. J2-11 TaxID=2943192 RepID=UPI0021C6B42D|nr:TIGR04283 family arsenosugar biosynthesis glycosyltransferase [Blastopirellula sp. J2-11]UUO08953.1 TIGR04283 family arsenosugar biosynthesis glycosyltransferase [Blastopirellula sp. J2-11]
MRVSVITAALNEEANIQAAVGSAQAAGADEIIVVDGGSADATVALATQAGATLIHSPPGRAIQQNAGVTASTGDVLLFLHADCRLSAESISQIRQRGGDFVFGAFRQKIDAASIVYRLVEWGNCLRIRWLGLPYGDQAIAVRRAIFEQAGQFADVPFLEDYLLSRKLRQQHWPTLLPGPVITSARRWRKQGVIRQTLLNWRLLAAYHRGVPLEELAARYRRHDQPK